MDDIFLKLMFNMIHELHNDLPFLPKRITFKTVEMLVANLHGKTEYVIHIRNFKQALTYELVLGKFHRLIQFNQNAWLKTYIDINTYLI